MEISFVFRGEYLEELIKILIILFYYLFRSDISVEDIDIPTAPHFYR